VMKCVVVATRSYLTMSTPRSVELNLQCAHETVFDPFGSDGMQRMIIRKYIVLICSHQI
jgi:hypothetical protein